MTNHKTDATRPMERRAAIADRAAQQGDRISERRERIVEAATQLFYKHGFEGTTMDAVAEEFGMTKPSVYSHFKNKSALLEEVCLRAIRASVDALDLGLSDTGTPTQRLTTALRAFFRVLIDLQTNSTIYFREERHFSAAGVEESERLRKQFDEKLSQLISDGVKTKEFAVTDIRLSALAIGGMFSWMFTWYRPNRRLREDEVAEHMLEFAFRVVGISSAGKKASARTSR